MTEQFLEDYFTNLATVLKDIAHTPEAPAFYRMTDAMDLDEFDNAVKNMASGTCLLLEIGDGDIGDWDSQKDHPRIGLHVLIKTTDLFADRNAARDTAKAILLKIVSRMRLDCKIGYDRPNGINGALRAQFVVFNSQVKFSNMSAIDGNWYGKSFYFEFSSALNLVYDANDWTG